MNEKCPKCGEAVAECAAKFLSEYARAKPKTRGLPDSKGIVALPYIFWPSIVELMMVYADHVTGRETGCTLHSQAATSSNPE